jgi:hypothetical protein
MNARGSASQLDRFKHVAKPLPYRDELLQLNNFLRSDMHLVGPRVLGLWPVDHVPKD